MAESILESAVGRSCKSTEQAEEGEEGQEEDRSQFVEDQVEAEVQPITQQEATEH